MRELGIGMVGPLTNLVLAILAAGCALAVIDHPDLWSWPFLQGANLPRSLVWANLYLAALNLLPAYPLDGGRILRAFFLSSLDMPGATGRAGSISNGIALVFMMAGVFSEDW